MMRKESPALFSGGARLKFKSGKITIANRLVKNAGAGEKEGSGEVDGAITLHERTNLLTEDFLERKGKGGSGERVEDWRMIARRRTGRLEKGDGKKRT